MGQSIKLRDLKAGARISRQGDIDVVTSVDWADSLISVDNGKIARALRVYCANNGPFLGHPDEEIMLALAN